MIQLLQLGGVTRGLIYMHEHGIVHGDLKGVRFRTVNHHHLRNLPTPKLRGTS